MCWMQDIVLIRIRAMSSLRVCWPLYPDRDVVGIGGSKAYEACEAGLFLLHGCCYPVRDQICSPHVGIEIPKFGLDQAPFPLNACRASEEVITEAS